MKVGILTSGGLAPCLSAAVGGLLQRYSQAAPETQLLAYRNGYQGLLLGQSRMFSLADCQQASALLSFGGSPIGNSRVKLSNVADCVRRGLIADGENPFEVAAKQLMHDGVHVLHTIGGDDTSTTAAELARFLQEQHYPLTIVGLPKTIDNDITPVRCSLGATTAAEQGAVFFEHIVHEYSANPKTILVHEVMGRHCGWLTYATAAQYMQRLQQRSFVPQLGFAKEFFEIHGLYIPEIPFDLAHEIRRLRPLFERIGSLNLWVSEGACVSAIVQEREMRGEKLARDAFGHVKLDHVNAGQWIGEQLAQALGAQKLLVQKSGYFARSALANAFDVQLIQSCVNEAVACALKGQSGLIGQDERFNGQLRCIEFEAVRGGKPLNVQADDVKALLARING